MDCLFCKIASGEIPSDTLYEDGEIKVFKDISPKAPVHFLVIPKIHIQSIAHLDPVRSQPRHDDGAADPIKSDRTSNGVEKSHADLIVKMIYAAKDIASRRNLTGYKLVFNVGREGGQVIDHLHLHVLGGWGKSEEKKINV